MFFVTGTLYWIGGLLFIIANLAFGAALVFYNGFLNEITTEDQRDKVSSRGFAYGYLGGGLLLGLNFLLVKSAGRLGIDPYLAVRLSLLSAGLWWGGFSLITFASLKTRAVAKSLPRGKSLPDSWVLRTWSNVQGIGPSATYVEVSHRLFVFQRWHSDGHQHGVGPHGPGAFHRPRP